MDLKEEIKRIVEPIISDLGYQLHSINFGSESGRFAIVIKINKEGGVSIEDCVKVSRLINPILEEADLIKREWILIISSPGIN